MYTNPHIASAINAKNILIIDNFGIALSPLDLHILSNKLVILYPVVYAKNSNTIVINI